MKYGYGRVSTYWQYRGTSLESQRESLIKAGAEVIIEEVVTGAKTDRKGLLELLDKIQEGDTLIACKLDRIARSMEDGLQLIQGLLSRGVNVEILNIGRLDNSPIGKLLIGVMFAIAEFERDMIIERTQTGKEKARAKGKKVDGRPPKYTSYQIDHALELLQENSYSEVEKMTGISISTLTRAKRKEKSQFAMSKP